MRASWIAGWSVAAILAAGVCPARAESVQAEGVVRSESRVEIKSKTVSPIAKIAVVEGQTVDKGDLLVEMVNDVENAEVEAAKAEVERARSALADAELKKKTADRELERNESVHDLITERDLELSRDAADQAATTYDMRQKELTKAEAHLTLSKAVYEGTFIRAPFRGQVSRIYTSVGTMPKPADTELMDLVELDKLYVELAVPLEYLGLLKTGMPVDLVVEKGNPANETRVKGAIQFIYPEIDPTIRMVRLKVSMPSKGTRILPGMFAQATIDLPSAPHAPAAH